MARFYIFLETCKVERKIADIETKLRAQFHQSFQANLLKVFSLGITQFMIGAHQAREGGKGFRDQSNIIRLILENGFKTSSEQSDLIVQTFDLSGLTEVDLILPGKQARIVAVFKGITVAGLTAAISGHKTSKKIIPIIKIQ